MIKLINSGESLLSLIIGGLSSSVNYNTHTHELWTHQDVTF